VRVVADGFILMKSALNRQIEIDGRDLLGQIWPRWVQLFPA
jgi:hypothetical protein